MANRYFEYVDGKSSKFWAINHDGKVVTVRFGKIGTDGQAQTKTFSDVAAAKVHADKLIAEKTKKGYVEKKRAPARPPVSATGISDIYLVSGQITAVPKREIDHLEKAVGNLPHGYREFLAHCGQDGELCDEIHVWSPAKVVKQMSYLRKHYTWDEHIEMDHRDPGPLRPADFDELWSFGSTVHGDRLFYFPRLAGEIFNLRHNEDKIVRHKQGFREPWKVGYCPQHPFPYFQPANKTIGVRPYSFPTEKASMKLAQFAERYWEAGESRCVRMPKTYGDTIMVFVKSIGGVCSFVTDERNYAGKVYGSTRFEKKSLPQVKAFEAALSDYAAGTESKG